MEQPKQLTIGEVASRVGIRTSAIRFYERVGLLPAPQRINGRRQYEAAVIQKIRGIQMAQKAGFTVGEIRTLFYEFPIDTPPSARWHTLSKQKLAEIEVLQNRVNTMRSLLEQTTECQCATLDDCMAGIETLEAAQQGQRLCDGSITPRSE
ncbi:MAG: MerR family transcriptional regulator [Chloroflexota bacterium]